MQESTHINARTNSKRVYRHLFRETRPSSTEAYSSSSGACPSDEEMAAYIDGTLGKAESQRVTEHLASCDDCYDLYMEAAHFLVDSSPAMPEDAVDEGRVVPIPSPAERGRQVLRWLPIAALLLVGVGGGTYFQFLKTPPELAPSEVVGSIPNQPALIPGLWRGPTYRGEGGEEEAKLNDASFRMGVQLVNLQMSLRAGKGQEAEDIVARILGILKTQTFTDDLQKGYTEITLALENHKAPADLLPEVSRLAGLSRETFEDSFIDLGQWVEAGRLAALARDPSFFQQADARSFLRRSIWRAKLGIGGDEARLDPPSRRSLERIGDIVSRGDLRTSDYAELGRRFDQILGIHYPDT